MKSLLWSLPLLGMFAPSLLGWQGRYYPTEPLRDGRLGGKLILRDSDISRIKRDMASDDKLAAMVKDLSTNTRPFKGGNVSLATTRRAFRNITDAAFLYRLTGDKKYLDIAHDTMMWAADQPDWDPKTFLISTELLSGVALGLDWLWNDLSSADRDRLQDALRSKGLEPAVEQLGDDIWWGRNKGNHNVADTTGVILAAMASPKGPAQEALAKATAASNNGLGSYSPDGGWEEGPMYWRLATRYATLGQAAWDTYFGSPARLPEGFADTGMFRLHMTGPSGQLFNFGDADPRPGPASFLGYLAKRTDQPVYAWIAQDQLAGNKADTDAFSVLWYQKDPASPSAARLPLGKVFKGIDVAAFRTSWADDALWVGFKGGANGGGHSHVDLGTFVLDALGERWAEDLGREDYKKPGVMDRQARGQYYRLGTLGHNTLNFDGENQSLKAKAPIVRSNLGSDRSFAIVDLGKAYAFARSQQRGIALVNKDRVVVQDEFELNDEHEAEWRMQTMADVSINGDTVTLKKGGKSLFLVADASFNGKWTVEDVAKEAEPGAKAITYSGRTKGRGWVQVTLSPTERRKESYRPLSQW